MKVPKEQHKNLQAALKVEGCRGGCSNFFTDCDLLTMLGHREVVAFNRALGVDHVCVLSVSCFIDCTCTIPYSVAQK